ncbi:MAG: hypothetical protein HYV27_10460 [Candidatus Hydrogenedentes bacterium]|nr:hypothetical protein [Candidatus Hydrogenedentota bacterium]
MLRLLAVCACALPLLAGCKKPEPPPPPPVEIAPEEAKPVGFIESLPDAVFQNLFFGYTYETCLEQIGRPEDETESAYDPGDGEYRRPAHTQWRIWRFKDGSVLRLGFQSGELRDKKFEPASAVEPSPHEETPPA